ncbi:MAG: hypothetical protein ACWA44_02430 [Thiotrichales bacterium]
MERVLLTRGNVTFSPTKKAFDANYETKWKNLGWRPATEEDLALKMEEQIPEPQKDASKQGSAKTDAGKGTSSSKKDSAKDSAEK